MVVKLYFTDGSFEVRSFSDKELSNLKLTERLWDYFNDKLSPDFVIDGYEIIKNEENDVEDYTVRTFDLRDYFNYSNSFIGCQIGDKVVERAEFFDEGSYEYNLDSLDNLSYKRTVKFNYPYEYYELKNPRKNNF